MKRVVVAMSGGVDSSVAALLLREAGYEVVGVTMRLWTLPREGVPPTSRSCCSVEHVEDARRVCHRLGIPHYFLNFEREFRAFVVDYFVAEYARGRTPYPCLPCNSVVRFRFLLQRARALGADFIATGHYARVVRGEDGLYHLLKGVDPAKDQSFVLFGLGQEQLERLLLPLGGYTKAQVRELARRAGLPTASKPDSQEICFVTQGDYRRFLAQRLPPRPGPVVDTGGRVLGMHRGVHLFTVGQRRGLGVSAGRPLYVVALDPVGNRVVVGTEEELRSPGLLARGAHWVLGRPPDGPFRARVRIRYRAPEAGATAFPAGDGVRVVFDRPQNAVAPGQPVVFYAGEEVLGGAIIERALTPAEVEALAAVEA